METKDALLAHGDVDMNAKAMVEVLKASCSRYIQLHWLVNRWAANRNEDGTLKSVTFGGVARLRTSSQSQKATWRYCEDEELGIRTIRMPSDPSKTVSQSNPSRIHFERILARLPKDGVDESTRRLVVKAVYDTVVGLKGAEGKADKKLIDAQARMTKTQEKVTEAEAEYTAATDEKAKKALEKKIAKLKEAVERAGVEVHNAGGDVELDDDQAQAVQDKSAKGTDQVMILSEHETDLLVQLTASSLEDLAKGDEKSHYKVVQERVRRWKSEHGEEFRSMQLGCGIQSAVFGRPVYGGGLYQQAPAAVGVAHEISVHKQKITYDTFTAQDVFKKDEMGAGMLGELPLASGLFYGYAFIDTHLLIENIERELVDSALAAEVVRRLILMSARVSSNVKHGSLASKNKSLVTLVEVGDDQPATFAEAFIQPVTVDRDRPDMLVNAFDRMARFIRAIDAAHPTTNQRAMAIVDISDSSVLAEAVPTVLGDKALAQWALQVANHEAVFAEPAARTTAHKNGHPAVATAPPAE
jgi:CRISPR system Cascade subunit CasC